MADSFGSVGLNVLPGGYGGGTTLTYSEEVVPGSTPPSVFIDIAGPGSRHISLALIFTTPADEATLEGMVGETHTLTSGLGAVSGDALLVSVTPTSAAPLGETWCTAEFVLV